MPVNPFDGAFSLKVEPSTQKKLLIIVPHILTALLVISVEAIPSLLSVLLIVLIFISGGGYYRLHIMKTIFKGVYEIGQDSARNWFLVTRNNQTQQVLLRESSFVSQFLIILNYIDINNTKYVVVFTPDSLSVGDFRRLIVRIKKA